MPSFLGMQLTIFSFGPLSVPSSRPDQTALSSASQNPTPLRSIWDELKDNPQAVEAPKSSPMESWAAAPTFLRTERAQKSLKNMGKFWRSLRILIGFWYLSDDLPSEEGLKVFQRYRANKSHLWRWLCHTGTVSPPKSHVWQWRCWFSQAHVDHITKWLIVTI